MKPDSDSDRSHESVINDTLARFLRERCSLSAAPVTVSNGGGPLLPVSRHDAPDMAFAAAHP
jgi:hypothetical protein